MTFPWDAPEMASNAAVQLVERGYSEVHVDRWVEGTSQTWVVTADRTQREMASADGVIV